MTQAMNLANFSNYLDSSGQVAPTVLNAPVPASKGGTGGTTATGTGSVVLATSPTISSPTVSGGTFSSPTLTTAALGTPASGVMTNVTGLPLTSGVSGTLPIANGGTGVITSTGSGSNVLNNSPTITSATITSATITNPTINGTPVIGTSLITSRTAVASTSGTAIDFTSIPSWVKRITVIFKDFSTNGSGSRLVQLGAGSIQTTGYSSCSIRAGGIPTSTIGLLMDAADNSSDTTNGILTIALVGSNSWVAASSFAFAASSSNAGSAGGSVTLSGTLDRIRITTSNGSDTFDSGLVNILYE